MDDKELQKEAMKEALNEWLEAKWAMLGRWTASGIAVAVFGALAYFYLTNTGWHR